MIHFHNVPASDSILSSAAQNTGTTTNSRDSEAFRGVLSEATGQAAMSSKSVSTEGGNIDRESWDKITPVTPDAPDSSPATGASSTTATSTAPPSDYDPFLQYVNSTSYTTGSSTTAPASSAASGSSALTAQEAFDNAYWAAQPPAVQALRNMPADERVNAATQLANEGYSIDVPIMVWGWDPYTVTQAREANGYTWVPSALQPSLPVAPGITTYGTIPPYDPNDPPAGAISV
jgi:hypothetical protein